MARVTGPSAPRSSPPASSPAPTGPSQDSPSSILHGESPMGNIAGETGISGAPPQAPNRNDSPFSPFKGRSPKDQIEKKMPGANFEDPKAFHEYYAVNHPKELKDSRTARAEKYGYNQQYDFTPRVDEEGNPVRLSEIMNQQSPDSRTVGNRDMDAVGQSRDLSNPDDTTFAFSQQTSQGVREQVIAQEDTLRSRDRGGGRERTDRALPDNPVSSGDGSPSRGRTGGGNAVG